MSKYYHNDYKKALGIDESRTASEKLLDKAIGGFRTAPETSRPVEKKVKEEAATLTHAEVLAKLVKNIENNKNAVKLVKPLTILKKCLHDQAFINAADINNTNQWQALLLLLMEADDKLIGNYSEVSLVIDCLVEIIEPIIGCLKKLSRESELVKEEQQQVAKQQQELAQRQKQSQQALEMAEIHLIYLKLYTDDSFAFNKLLQEFKIKFFLYFDQQLQGKLDGKAALCAYLHKLLSRLFNLPHSKYEWLKQSLSQFFKEFNIAYKHTLPQDTQNAYLKTYNEFIQQKASKAQGESVNIFGTSTKGAKVATLEVGPADGLDKWTSKQ